ncbi:MAG TPA: J domain-containing protein [Oligoflexia bacterium]|nr:J domain-containing protein [Oligoflexia bacterium]HMP48285.1 J domain-containing protein [Oligoflexia bacterium]
MINIKCSPWFGAPLLLVTLFVLIFLPEVRAENQPIKPEDRAYIERAISDARSDILLKTMPDVLFRADGDLCLFSDKKMSFVSQLVSPCRALFDRILDEAIDEGQISKELLAPGVSQDFLRYLLLEFSRTGGERKDSLAENGKNSKISASESLEQKEVRIAKIALLILRMSDSLSSSESSNSGAQEKTDSPGANLRGRLFEILFTEIDEFHRILLSVGGEEHVVALGRTLLRYKDEFDNYNIKGLLLRLLLVLLYEDASSVKSLLEDLVPRYRFQLIEVLDTSEFRSVLDTFENQGVVNTDQASGLSYINLVGRFYKECSAGSGNLTLADFCAERASELGEEIRDLIVQLFMVKFSEGFIRRFNNPKTVLTDDLLDYISLPEYIKNSNSFGSFIENVFRPFVAEVKLSDENRKQVCIILGESESCKINPDDPTDSGEKKSDESPYSFYLLSFLALVLVSVSSFVLVRLFKDKQKVSAFFKFPNLSRFLNRKSLGNAEKESSLLNQNERAELRELRNYFKLTPTQGNQALFKRYRAYVKKTHPDRAKDGGDEFINLQERFKRAKELLERLEDERVRRRGND